MFQAMLSEIKSVKAPEQLHGQASLPDLTALSGVWSPGIYSQGSALRCQEKEKNMEILTNSLNWFPCSSRLKADMTLFLLAPPPARGREETGDIILISYIDTQGLVNLSDSPKATDNTNI